jgi:hypothetical protein
MRRKSSANAYHQRYIARRAVTLRDGKLAVSMMHQSLASDWRIALEEPQKTAMTIGAAYLLKALPKRLYFKLESLAIQSIVETPDVAAPARDASGSKGSLKPSNPFTKNLPASELPSQPL